MAYWQRNAHGHVRVFTRVDGKQRALPRKKVKHLDGKEDHNVQEWVDTYTLTVENKPSRERFVLSCDTLAKYVEDFCSYQIKHRQRREANVRNQRRMLLKHVIPFFVDRPQPLRDPNQWTGVSVKLLPHLQAAGVTDSNIREANKALMAFWHWLTEEQITDKVMLLRYPIVERKVTPLKFTVTPADVLAFATQTPDADMRFIALAGFFMSLRPQETCGLRREDFRTGTLAAGLEAAKVMSAVPGLTAKLVTNVARQRVKSGVLETCKAGSRGWVACFNEEAARQLVDLVKASAPGELILREWKPDWYTRRWAKVGMPEVAMKDLRRASIYWLGHTTAIQPVPLMRHARHVSLDTTALYLRRPDETQDGYVDDLVI